MKKILFASLLCVGLSMTANAKFDPLERLQAVNYLACLESLHATEENPYALSFCLCTAAEVRKMIKNNSEFMFIIDRVNAEKNEDDQKQLLKITSSYFKDVVGEYHLRSRVSCAQKSEEEKQKAIDSAK